MRSGTQIATIIQDDLKQIGMRVGVVTLDQSAMLDRIMTSHDYDACVLGLAGGDGDPNSEMNVWLSSGATHLWRPGPARAGHAVGGGNRRADAGTDQDARCAAPQAPLRSRPVAGRRQLPIISLVSPNVLVGATDGTRELPADCSRSSGAVESRGAVLARETSRCAAVTPGKKAATACSATRMSHGAIRGWSARVSTATSRPWATLIAKYKNLIYSIPLEIRRPAAGRRGHFSVGLPRTVLRAAAAAQRRGGAQLDHQGHLAPVLPLEAEAAAARRGRADPDSTRRSCRGPSADVLEEIERAQILREAVAALPPRCREIIRLLFYEPEPVSYRDLAARLGLATGSIGFIRGRCLNASNVPCTSWVFSDRTLTRSGPT